MDPTDLKRQIKALIVSELNLEGKDPLSIEDDAPLFGQADKSLGLDSLDALQLAMSLEERFGVALPEGEAARPVFQSVSAIAAHIAAGSPRL
jgi:acyl carrier protein